MTNTICAQDTISVTSADTIISVADSVLFANDTIVLTNDSVFTALDDSTFLHHKDSALISISDSTITTIPANKEVTAAKKEATSFKPNPKTAYLAAAVFPGFGQFYNRQYWKLPIVYGGLMGCAYAVTWNNKVYQDYKTAYFALMEDAQNDPKGENPDSWDDSWQAYTNSSATDLHNTQFQNRLKSRKDYFRRYRDLSIIIGVGLYLIFVADAYVDAQMFDFDVSPDLSFRFTPEFRPETLANSHSFGVNICMTF